MIYIHSYIGPVQIPFLWRFRCCMLQFRTVGDAKHRKAMFLLETQPPLDQAAPAATPAPAASPAPAQPAQPAQPIWSPNAPTMAPMSINDAEKMEGARWLK